MCEPTRELDTDFVAFDQVKQPIKQTSLSEELILMFQETSVNEICPPKPYALNFAKSLVIFQ